MMRATLKISILLALLPCAIAMSPADLSINSIKATPHAAAPKRSPRPTRRPRRKPATQATQPPSQATSPRTPRTLLVSLAGNTPYSTIGSAIGAAQVGDSVVVQAGLYHETVTLSKPISLTVAPGSAPGTVVLEGQGQPALVVNASVGRIYGVCFRISSQPQDLPVCDVEVESGGVVFQDCEFGASLEGGVFVHGAGVSPKFQHCTFHDCGKTAANVTDNANPSFANCTIECGTSSGISADTSAPTIAGGTIRAKDGKSGTFGIRAVSESNIVVSDCDIGVGLASGIRLDASAATVSNCRIHDVGHEAVRTVNGGNATVDGCDISACGEGGLHAFNAAMTVTGCKLHDLSGAGVIFERNSTGILKNVSVERSRSSAYVVNDGSHVRLESCEAKDIRDNGYQANSSTMKLTGCTAELIANCGLLGIGSAKVSAANGALTGRIGAKTTGTALMTLDTCTISGCSDWGVAAMGGPINAVKCNFSGNKLGDIKPYEARQNH